MAKLIVGLTCALALGACAATTTDVPITQTPFSPASCYDRDIDIYFDTTDGALPREGRGVIDALVEQLAGCTIDSVVVIGFAGVRGPEDVNEAVSAERAREIADYLVDHHHWERGRIEVRATGERGAVSDQGAAPMRRRGRLIVEASPPAAS